MRILIVDDEPAARRRLRRMVEELGAEVAGEAADGVEALRLARELRPDLLLLDISMPEVDGFDVARHLPEPRPVLVFQTAHDEHALRAFDHEALDYVVKPVTRERLAQALARVERYLAGGSQGSRLGGLTPEVLARVQQSLARTAGGAPGRKPRLLVRSGRGHRLVPLDEITRFVAREGLVYAYGPEGRQLTDYTLAELEERTAGLFLRVHRSALVSLDAVEGIVSNGDGSATLTLSDGTAVRVSRRRAAEAREALGL